MKQYLLSVYQPAGDPPPPEVLEQIMARPRRRQRELEAAGAWVFAGGLHPPEHGDRAARPDGGEVLMTDGPFAEGKEHLGGFTIVTRPRPRRRARVGRAGSRGDRASRSRCGRSRARPSD